MLKIDAVSLDQMEQTYPGIKKTVASFEAMVLPPCTHCDARDTAFVQIGVIGRTIALTGATSKVKLLANRTVPHKYFCNICGRSLIDNRPRPDPQHDQADQPLVARPPLRGLTPALPLFRLNRER